MGDYGFLTALILGIWAYFSIIGALAGWGTAEALVSGFITGLVVGDVKLGLEIGATLTLMSLGMATYGGATIPDFNTAAIIGTAIGAAAGGANAAELGLGIAIPVALFMTQLDVLGRATTTFFMHGAEQALEKGNLKSLEKWHLMGTIPWGLSRGIPVFLGVLAGQAVIDNVVNAIPAWFMHGMRVTGSVLPALGFALLLSMMNLNKNWPYALIGYALFAYLGVPTLGLAFIGLALAFIITKNRGGVANV
ncbi:PTS sugar transporter subunit IIC [Gottschalkiaceae bacterium SANA]|jgi:PTS system mannose-specific IIC component|nr:PTS sugar transporter subunit IIC [Gottschalkiaceae bacterium SANA]